MYMLSDNEGYPTQEACDLITGWPPEKGYTRLMDMVHDLWAYARAGGWTETPVADFGIQYEISTGGWSGNEDLIQALKQNHLFWASCWSSSQRGGHFIFIVPH
jgi:hypothetical protein